MDSDVEWYSF